MIPANIWKYQLKSWKIKMANISANMGRDIGDIWPWSTDTNILRLGAISVRHGPIRVYISWYHIIVSQPIFSTIISSERDITKNGNDGNPTSQFQLTLPAVPATSFCLWIISSNPWPYDFNQRFKQAKPGRDQRSSYLYYTLKSIKKENTIWFILLHRNTFEDFLSSLFFFPIRKAYRRDQNNPIYQSKTPISAVYVIVSNFVRLIVQNQTHVLKTMEPS